MPVVSFLLFVVVTSFTPGPNNLMAMAFANKNGYKKTTTFCMGVGFGFFVIILCCLVFNRLLLHLMPTIELPLSLFGVGYMLYLAFKILTSKDTDSNNDKDYTNFFIIGALLQFINPKAILYGITVVSTFILPYYTSMSSYLVLSAFLGIVGIMSTFTWSLLGSMLQTFVKQYQKPFNVLMALLLVYSACTILFG
ncbi:LysE family transporter [Sporosarcina sp. Te-1]|uniref:LysE family transporter n=1 Tax=Sporosarcina sp. Te-1 TaxID=2818390 RepID=UPI001A9E52DA|nr:LysE family transporter [Sporosarcina sp. Te-1]QTD40316.1 LysE family transporter [Sporosarcina sp. Te-1]